MIADVAVRLATLADATAISAMSHEHIERGLPWRWTPARIARAIRDADTNVVVVGEPGRLAAFGIMSYPADEAHLLLFAVRAAQRRRGIGSAVLHWLEAAARAAGARCIRVEARFDNAGARQFYAEHGYHERRIARGMYGATVDGVCLEKWLRDGS